MVLRYFSSKDFAKWEKSYRRNFFNSIGGYKSINLIGTRASNGRANLGLFFSVTHLGSTPPLVGVIFRSPTVPRHTLENIYETGFFTINSVQRNYIEEAHQASAKYPENLSEFQEVGLRESYHANFLAPYVERSRIKMGLSFVEKHEILANGTVLVVGEVVECWVDGDALGTDGFVDHSEIGNVAVNGLDTYYSTAKIAKMPYARPEDDEVKKSS